MAISEALYFGTVVHKRLSPIQHALRYTVFSCLFDCDRLDDLHGRLKLFSYNRFNLLSLHDRDHTDGKDLKTYLREIAAGSGYDGKISRFMMLSYPRVLGYAFNPLTVYFGLDGEDAVCLTIYEVRNTFGSRRTYVLPAEPNGDGLLFQSCRKRLYVSPFNPVEGSYSFHARAPGRDITVGVAYRNQSGPILKAHFKGRRHPMTDATLLRALTRTGWMTVKVILAIHYEALKLWLKGLRPTKRPRAPERPITFIKTPKENV